MSKRLTLRYPATWAGDMWREGAPFGNGKIGGLVYGGTWKENIQLNHAFLWRGGKEIELPDVSEAIAEARRLLDEYKVKEADSCIMKALKSKGYTDADVVLPTPVCDIVFNTTTNRPFAHYRREIDMEKALVTVKWDEDAIHYERKVFASRSNDVVYTSFTAENGLLSTVVSLDVHDRETQGSFNIEVVAKEAKTVGNDGYLFFAEDNKSIYKPGNYGAVARIITDGKTEVKGKAVRVDGATEVTVATKLFIETPYEVAFAELEKELREESVDFGKELKKHEKKHREYFDRVKLDISAKKNTSNEELLLDAYEEEASNELIEKLYDYGRYLFICSTGDSDTLPCHLLGLFTGTYQSFWAIYMYNVNHEMIYWQALSGNLPSFMRLALDYTESFIDDYRENARKIFGCRGIFINSVNTPESGIGKCLGNHILNWTGGAAWISQHFWDYYRFTGDEEYLREHALPFMREAAHFYEDFAVENGEGYYDLYPSVSPENTPKNVFDEYDAEIETAKNATMEFALMKELLTNLIKGAEITGMYQDEAATWKMMLTKIPPYRINDEGAVREWADEYYEDNYAHRHQSHLYPVFPGCEIKPEDEECKFFEKAIDLRYERGLTAQSSWSAVNMAGVGARLGQGDFSLELLSNVTRTCLMNNFFTVHNDWRRMGSICCGDFRMAPFQIDANIGITGVINEMLLQSQNDDIVILPALPYKWKKGKIKGLLARGNVVCGIEWNGRDGKITLEAKNEVEKKVTLRSGYVFEDGTASKVMRLCGKIEARIIGK